MDENQLTNCCASLATVSQGNGLSELIKPLIRELLLTNTFVAGTVHIRDRSVFEELKQGDSLTLIHNSDDPYDEFVVVVQNAVGKKLGCIPDRENIIFSRLLDAGKRIYAKVKSVSITGFSVRVSIDIYMTDY